MITIDKNQEVTAGDIFQKVEKTESLSIITKALEEAHELIRKETGAPRAVIVVGRDAKVHGHFTPYTPWQTEEDSFHEIFLSASSFNRGARATLGTLLHETAHSIDNAQGIRGVTSEGYHNKNFKQRAEGLGLTITQAGRIGWSNTEVSDECAERWSHALRLIEEALLLTADSAEVAKPKGRNKNLLVAECGCGEKIRLSAKTLEKCAPICSECEQMFEVRG